MTEQVPVPQEYEQADWFGQLDLYLQAAEEHATNGSEIPTEDEAYLVDLAGRVSNEKVTIQGQAWGGVEIPDTTEIRYSISLKQEDDSTTTVPIDSPLAKRLIAYADAHKPVEAETDPKPTGLGEEADATLAHLQGKSELKDKADAPVAPTPKRSTKRDGIADLVRLDTSGRARYGNEAELKGNMIPKYELDKTEEMQGMIRDGLADRNVPGTILGKRPVVEIDPDESLSDRELYIDELEHNDAISYNKIGDPNSGEADDKTIQKRKDKLLWEYDHFKTSYDNKVDEYVEKKPSHVLGEGLFRKLGRTAIKQPFEEVKQYAAQRRNEAADIIEEPYMKYVTPRQAVSRPHATSKHSTQPRDYVQEALDHARQQQAKTKKNR